MNLPVRHEGGAEGANDANCPSFRSWTIRSVTWMPRSTGYFIGELRSRDNFRVPVEIAPRGWNRSSDTFRDRAVGGSKRGTGRGKCAYRLS